MTITIALVNNTEREAQTRDQLLRLLDQYDLTGWQFTDHVQIAQGVMPHSHPVLTLNTRELADDHGLLAVYLHEQAHWYTLTRPPGQAEVLAAMRARYPDLPVALPQGCGSERSNEIHLLVCPLEYLSMVTLAGEETARRMVAAYPFYMAIYAHVLRDAAEIRTLFARYKYGP